MKTKFFILVFSLSTFISFAQKQQKNIITEKEILGNSIYQLFPTKNLWTFIKLNTRNGKMWQVHFSVKEGDGRGTLDLNSLPLVSEEKEVNGRFTLYPSENTYNFLLLDQIDGKVYQVQWSMEENNRGIIPIQ